MKQEMQFFQGVAKLLRVLQSGELRPVGSDTVRQIDVRIVTATHRDLLKAIEAGRFRTDLYFRIHVLPIEVPSLRDRRADIPALARHFLDEARGRTPSSPVRTLGSEAEAILSAAPWPGNVRELKSVIERLVVFGRQEVVEASDLAFLSRGPQPNDEEHGLVSLRDVTERHVARVLAATRGDKRSAAAILGIDLSTLYRWCRRPPSH